MCFFLALNSVFCVQIVQVKIEYTKTLPQVFISDLNNFLKAYKMPGNFEPLEITWREAAVSKVPGQQRQYGTQLGK